MLLLPVLFQIILSAKGCGIVGCLECDDSVTPNLCTQCDTESYFQDLKGKPSTNCTCVDGWDFLVVAFEECQYPSNLYSVTLETENNVKPEVGVKCKITQTDPENAIYTRNCNYDWYRVNDQNAETKIDMEFSYLKEYTIVGEDVGHKIKVKATGNVSRGIRGTATSIIQDIVVTSLTSVTLATENNARPRVGIKCQVTDIQPPYADGKISYEWYRVDDQDAETSITVEDTSSKEYTLTSDDVGYKIKVKATGIETKGCNGETTSILSSTVLLSVVSVTLTTENNASPKAGVKCQITDIQPAEADGKVNYEWYRVDEQGTEKLITLQDNPKEYTLTVDDVGYKIKVKATGIEDKGYAGEATSILSSPVLLSLVSVTLTTENNASPKAGVKCQITDIQPVEADGKVNYEWYRVDEQGTETLITLQDNPKEYTLTDDDVGYKIKVKATGIEAKGCDGEATSILSSTVLLSVVSVTLTTENNASPKIGVKCQITDIQPVEADGKVNYEWYRVDEQGTEKLITLQDNPKEYTLTVDDVGYKIKVKATGNEAKGCTGDATSILEAAVLDLICPVGCQCDSHSDKCKSCKSDEHFIEKVGSDPKECECDSSNGYAFGSDTDSEKCVCDSAKHLIPGTGENNGNCVCEPDYKGDTINGCKFDKCSAFDQNCDQCDDDDNPQQCTHCKSDEYGVLDSTHKCALCKEVTNDSNCKTCQLNGAASYKCLSCIEGQIDGNSCTSTTCTTKDCATCTPDGATCLTCKQDFILTSTKQCQSQNPLTCKDVDENCKTCEQENGKDTSICSECNEGFFLDIKTSDTLDNTATKACTKCSDNCKTCKSATECQICKDNFGVTSNGKCEQCSSTQHVNQETHECKDNCETGTDLNKCKTCAEKDKSICGSCNDGSSLIEGKCIPDESPKQCPSGCICEDDKSVCERCQPGFKEKKNGNVIVSCDPDFTACNPEMKTKGCMYCLNEEPFNKCFLCNTNDDNIILEPNEDGICQCNNGYVLENGKCVPEKADCTTSIPGCSKCFKDNTKSCAVCSEENGFIALPIESSNGNNVCSCKVHGFEPNEKGVCAAPNESKCNPAIPGCLKCVTPDKCDICDTTKYYQSNNVDGKCECIEGYEINSQGVCNKPANSECNANIIGCLKCGTNKNKCIYCDTESNFVLDKQSKCVCDDGFELNKDGQCIESLKPAELITGESIPLSSDFVHQDPSNTNQLIVNTADMKVNSPYAIHYNQVEKEIKSISIEENQHDNIYMVLPTKGDLTVTKKAENSKCNLMLPMEEASSTTLTLMKESAGITIINYISDNILNLKSPDQGTIQLANFSTRESVKVSPENDITFEYINIFENGKVENAANNKKISAKHINIQRGAKGFLKGVEILEDLIVGPSSTTEFGDDVKYSGKTINIKYSRSQAVGKSFFTGIFKEVPKEIKVARIDSDLLLDDESEPEEMLVAEGSKTNFNPEICKSWAKIISGEFGNAKCDESDSTNNRVIATKSDDDGTNNNDNKKKLSGGEIAGIVIACVVAVAAVVALLVYFLVLKKKKNDTNLENDESSLSA